MKIKYWKWNINRKNLYGRSKKTQIELLKKAIQILKPGKEMVYSTCSILGEENEEVIKKFLNEVEVVPIDKNIFEIKLDYVYTYCMDGNQEGRKRYGYEKKAAPLHAVKREHIKRLSK